MSSAATQPESVTTVRKSHGELLMRANRNSLPSRERRAPRRAASRRAILQHTRHSLFACHVTSSLGRPTLWSYRTVAQQGRPHKFMTWQRGSATRRRLGGRRVLRWYRWRVAIWFVVVCDSQCYCKVGTPGYLKPIARSGSEIQDGPARHIAAPDDLLSCIKIWRCSRSQY